MRGLIRMKTRAAVFFLLGLFILQAKNAEGGSSVDVVMTIQDLGFYWQEGNPNVTVTITQNLVDNRRVIRSDANTRQDYSIRVASQSATPGWTLATHTSTLEQNEYRLRALWHDDSFKPATTEFQANDILTGTSQISSAASFWNDSETSDNPPDHSIPGYQGFNVYPGQYTSLYIWVRGPISGSTPGILTATLEITASAVP